MKESPWQMWYCEGEDEKWEIYSSLCYLTGMDIPVNVEAAYNSMPAPKTSHK